MPKVSGEALAEIRVALREYEQALMDSGMTERARATAYGDVERFVRWLDGDYEPMARNRRR